MDKFTQKELLKLGFERQYVPPEDNDGVNDYTYYYLGLDGANYTLSLISGVFENDIKEAEVTFFEGEKALSKELIELLIKELKK